MTWKDLKYQLNDLTEEQLNTDVTVLDTDTDEFFGCYSDSISINKDGLSDVLDDGHPFLEIKLSFPNE